MLAERSAAEEVDRAWAAIHNAKTWGDFRDGLLHEEWAEIESIMLEYLEEEAADGEAVSIDFDAPFDAEKLPGHLDGNYPTWLEDAASDIFSEADVEEFGRFSGGPGAGWALGIPSANEEKMLEVLRKAGHTVERTDLYIM